jgi:hypothetical protein
MTFVLIIGRTHYAIVSQRALICQYRFSACVLLRLGITLWRDGHYLLRTA